jgi:hypothetical protein
VTLAHATLVHVYAGGVIEDHIKNIENLTSGAGDDTLTNLLATAWQRVWLGLRVTMF